MRDGSFMSIIDDLLEFFGDGDWHSTIEVEKKFSLPINSLNEIMSFLSKYGFVELNDGKVRSNFLDKKSVLELELR